MPDLLSRLLPEAARLSPQALAVAVEGVEEAALLVVPDPEFGIVLAGFVVTNPATSPSRGKILATLRERLPAYEIPDRLFTLPSLPRTANGKVDRAALLAALDRGSGVHPSSA